MPRRPAVRHELSPDDLRWRMPDALLERDTAAIGPARKTVGQDRALQALRVAMNMRQRGFNAFVVGPDGTGRSTSVRRILDEVRATASPLIRDRCYVHNFKDTDRPRLLTLPSGSGARLRKDMERFIATLKTDLPALLESESFKKRAQEVADEYREKESKVLGDFEDRIKRDGFVFGQLKMGTVAIPDIIPMVGGSPVPMDRLDTLVEQGKLSQEEYDDISRRYARFHEELQVLLRKAREVAREMHKHLERLEREASELVIKGYVEDLKRSYPQPEVGEYLDEVHKDLLERLDIFKGETPLPGPLAALTGGATAPRDPFQPYQVNVILDTTGQTGCPVEEPETPTYVNLFGAIEMDIWRSGAISTDFTKIRGGALLRADGGYLVLQARDVLMSPGVYPTLKRVLKTGHLDVSLPDGVILTPATAMKPEPIPVDVRVLLIGEPWIYALLYAADDEFTRIFKVKAEFDDDMEINRDNVRHFVSVLHKVGGEESLLDLDHDALRGVIQYGVRLAGRRNRISTRFNEVADLYREASFWAARSGAREVAPEHVVEAVEAVRRRYNLPEERLQRMIDEGVIAIDVDGDRVGQVNGLAVHDLGLYAFGRPSRITATISLGRQGILNIEREVGLSGRIHDKGVLILSSFIRERYGRKFPLSISASLCFEQSYGTIDGDSASSTELYALISALADLPIRQGVAVTGAVDQRGNVLPIGGVNQKIEGFYDVCRLKGLTGRQGVIIPRTNVEDLMLRPDVVDEVRHGRFHVWAVSTIDEGIEILTGRPAGVRDKRGSYGRDTVNGRVEESLLQLARRLMQFDRRGK